jgi:hypothetical protein
MSIDAIGMLDIRLIARIQAIFGLSRDYPSHDSSLANVRCWKYIQVHNSPHFWLEDGRFC